MKIKNIILGLLIIAGNVFGDNLQCPISNSAYIECGMDVGYRLNAIDDREKYVQSSEVGSLNPFAVELLHALPANQAHNGGSTLTAVRFFGTDEGQPLGFECPPILDDDGFKRSNVNVVLDKINLETGKYLCRYEDTQSGLSLLTCNYTNKACAADISNIKNGFKAVRTKDHVSEHSRFQDVDPADNEFTGITINDLYKEQNPYGNIITLNYKSLGDAVDDLSDSNFLDVYGIAELYGLNDTTSDLNDGLKYKWNVAGIIAGLITLDTNYFDGVDIDGKLSLKKPFLSNNSGQAAVNGAVNSKNGVYGYLLGESTTINPDGINGLLKDSFINGSGNEKIQALKDFISQFDLKLWGFWVTMNSNLSKAYDKINQFAFFMAAIWMLGVLSFQRGIKTFNKMQDSTDYGMKIFSAAAGLIFFFVPMSTSTAISLNNTQGQSSYAKGLPSKTAVFNEDTTFSSEYRENMTIFKYIIIHFAQKANEFATTASNAIVVSYADYLASRQNGLETRAKIGRAMKDSYIHELVGEKNYEFYKKICVPMYYYGFQQRQTFLLSDKELKRYMSNQINKQVDGWDDISPYPDLATFRSISGIDEITPSVCRNIEKKFKSEVPLTLNSFHSIAEKVMHTDADTAVGTEIIIHNMFIMQSFLGWINSASMPVSYFLLKQANLFADEENQPNLSDRVNASKDMTHSMQNDVSKDNRVGGTLQSAGDSVSLGLGKAFSWPVKYSIYFMAPGFADIHKFIKEMLYNIFAKDEKGRYSKASSNTQRKVIAKILKLLNKANGLSLAFDLATSKPALFTLATALSIFIYMFIINIIFMSIIAILILLRIILYFIDLMKYFFVSPFVVIWAVTVNRSYEKVAAFIGQGAVLTLYPTLIVLSATIFIFAYELMQMLSGMLIGGLIAQLETQYSVLNSTSINGGDSFAFLDYMKIFTLQESLNLTMMLVSLFLAYKIIYEGPTWFLALFGYKEGDTHGGQMMREASEKVNKTSNPVI